MKGNPEFWGPVAEYAGVDEYFRVFVRVGFLFAVAHDDGRRLWRNVMNKSNSNVAEQIAQAACAFEQRRTGHAPKSVTVVLSDNTLVITLFGALSPAEQAVAKTATGAAQVQDFHRQLFVSASDSLRQEIRRITGVDVREATAEVDPTTGTVVGVFTTGTTIQVYLLAHPVRSDTWSGMLPNEPATKAEASGC